MLTDREREQADVHAAIASRRSELVIVYGRRGVGKSTLLTEVLADEPHLYDQATPRAAPQQIEDLTAALRTYAPDAVLPGVLASMGGFLAALLHLARTRPDRPLIVVLDELPYLAESDPAVASVLQRWWDEVRRERIRNVKLFLVGSLVSWMEQHTLSDRGPLHNRRTGQIKLEPLGYADAARFYPRYGPRERITAYAIWGGLPSYLAEIDPAEPLWDNVRERILRPGTRLADEPQWLRFADVRSDALYASILRAIDRPWRALFSRTGFTPRLRARSEDPEERLLLYTPRDLYR